jgi:hypothetical protein
VQPSGFQPNFFVAWTLLTTSIDQLSCCYHITGMFFYASPSDPSVRIFWVGLDHGVEQKTRFLDVSNFSVGPQDSVVEVG